MTATALDAGLCLLLVSAAALTVVGTQEPDLPAGRADATAETLAVTTGNVSYSLATDGREVGAPGSESGELDRVAHGTFAELLARAAFRNVSIAGDPLSNASADYRRGVRRAVAGALPPRTQVHAQWEPYPGSHVRGDVTVGPEPPAGRAVEAARFTVPVHVPPATGNATGSDAEADGYDRLAATIVRALFPPERLRFALHDDAPLPELVEQRYRAVGERYGVDTIGPLESGGPRAANERLRPIVAERVRADLRGNSTVRRSVGKVDRTDRVVVVVRAWSP